MALRPGYVIDGRYEVLAVQGEGAHGVVYRCLDLNGQAHVAVKLLADTARDPELRLRLAREARALTALRGTNAVLMHHFGTTEGGAFYLAMELLDGVDLEDWLQARGANAATLPGAALVRLLDPIVATLEIAHGRGIVHRDLKPGNIFVLSDGSVRLLDFGLVKLMGARPLTRQGVVAGSPSYIAPEAWVGDPTTLDHRIDIYALAAIAFRALAGRVPFDAENLRERITLVTSAKRPSLHALRPDLPPAIDPWVRQALAIDPADRFQRIASMWDALRSVVGS